MYNNDDFVSKDAQTFQSHWLTSCRVSLSARLLISVLTMTLYLYVSTVSGNHEVRSNQQRVQSVLDSMNIKYVPVDIASDENAKHKMMAALKAANKQPPYLAPQFFFGDEYIGGYKEFEDAVEDSRLEAFLRV